MRADQDTTFQVKDYRLTIPNEHLSDMQQILTQAANAGQSPHPFKAEHDVKGLVLAVWGLDLFANQQGQALTKMDVPPRTSLQTFDTFLSLIAPFVAIDKPAYFNVIYQAEDGDQEFFYHMKHGKVLKEERITVYLPVALDIKHPRGSDTQYVKAEDE